jgi:hypothetical protein
MAASGPSRTIIELTSHKMSVAAEKVLRLATGLEVKQ